MADRAAASGKPVEVFLGRYQDLPLLRRVGTDEVVDLRAGGRFDAAMLGWSSFSHIRHRQDRIATLQRFAEVTDGPVVASFFLRRDNNRATSWRPKSQKRASSRWQSPTTTRMATGPGLP
jgi:hypothetical protein